MGKHHQAFADLATRAVGYGVAMGRNVLTVMLVRGAKEIPNPFGEELGQEAWEMAGHATAEEEMNGGLAASERAVEMAIRSGGGFIGGVGLSKLNLPAGVTTLGVLDDYRVEGVEGS